MSKVSNFKKSVKFNLLTFPYFIILLGLLFSLIYIDTDAVSSFSSLQKLNSVDISDYFYFMLLYFLLIVLFLMINYFYTYNIKKKFRGAEQQKIIVIYKFMISIIIYSSLFKMVWDLYLAF